MIKTRIQSLFQFSIRVKLLLALIILLIIPIMGFQYIKGLETFLREDQQSRLLENVRIISSVISSQKKRHSIFESKKSDTDGEHLYIKSLSAPILLDGFNDDWQFEQEQSTNTRTFKSPNTASPETDPLVFAFSAGHQRRNVYIFFKVKDKHLLYQPTQNKSITRSDHILIISENDVGKLSHYIISTHSPGSIQAKQVIRVGKNKFEYKLFPRINAVWQETTIGYNVEIKIPESLLGKKVAFAVIDLDQEKNPQQREMVVASRLNSLNQLNSLSIAQPSLNLLLQQLSLADSKTWLINNKRNIVADSGSLISDNRDLNEFVSSDNFNLSVLQFLEGLIRLVYESILPQPSEHIFNNANPGSNLSGDDIDKALSGTATTLWRATENTDVNILRAAYPITVDKHIIGAVAVEKNSNSILLLQNRAVEILMNTSIVVFLLSAFLLVSVARRLTYRITRLRDETSNAISEDGRIQADNISAYMLETRQGDEIDDLQRSFAGMLTKLSDYNRYLESMASKLSHELRTPITVVKSSLENIEYTQKDNINHSFLNRAKEGINRLNDILTRMSEATRLEQSLKAEHKQSFDLVKIVRGCFEGYKIVFSEYDIRIQTTPEILEDAIMIIGNADLIAQMLDKLLSNAVDFSDKDTAILIRLVKNDESVTLSVSNTGSSLPDHMQSNLFESMVSVREKRSEQPHLGLGLYIVRLIAEFHDAMPFARNISVDKNRDDFSPEKTLRLATSKQTLLVGVEVGVEFRLVAKEYKLG